VEEVLLMLIGSSGEKLKEEAARAIANLTMSREGSLKCAGSASLFLDLIREGNESTQEVAAMTLANLVRLDQGQASCIDAGGVGSLVDLMIEVRVRTLG